MPVPRSLVWATDIDTLPPDRIVERDGDHLTIRSPGNPEHWWGNLLLFDDAPAPGDGMRWERAFAAAFAQEPRIAHRAFAWDRIDGELGAVHAEFVDRGYVLERIVGLVGTPSRIVVHARANREVSIHALDPDADQTLWAQVLEMEVLEHNPNITETEQREFWTGRLTEFRGLFRVGAGAWYVALDGSQAVLASCAVVATENRASVQNVTTRPDHRRRGISSRLLVDAVHDAARRFDVDRFVIAADPGYHALGIYESLGFTRTEEVAGVYRPPARAV